MSAIPLSLVSPVSLSSSEAVFANRDSRVCCSRAFCISVNSRARHKFAKSKTCSKRCEIPILLHPDNFVGPRLYRNRSEGIHSLDFPPASTNESTPRPATVKPCNWLDELRLFQKDIAAPNRCLTQCVYEGCPEVASESLWLTAGGCARYFCNGIRRLSMRCPLWCGSWFSSKVRWRFPSVPKGLRNAETDNDFTLAGCFELTSRERNHHRWTCCSIGGPLANGLSGVPLESSGKRVYSAG